jgi:flagellin
VLLQKTSFNGKKLFDGSTLEFDLFVDGLSSNKSRMRVDFSDMLQTPLALGVAQIKFNSKFNASLSLNPIDNAINEISSSRAKLGAVMQSLESQVSKLSQDYESLNSANSTRVDTDYAEVTSENVKEKIKRESQLSSFSNFNSSRSHLLKLLS